MIVLSRTLVAASVLAAALGAQSLRVDGAWSGFVWHGGETVHDAGGRVFAAVAPGDGTISFEADANGRPAPLPLTVPADGGVLVAVAAAPVPGLMARHDFTALPALPIVDDVATGGPSRWCAEAGELVQKAAIGGAVDDPRRPGTRAVVVVDGGDLRTEVAVRAHGGGSLGVGLRQQQNGDGLRWHWDRTAQVQQLEFVRGDQVAVLHAAPAPADDGCRFAAVVVGAMAIVFVDGEPVLSAAVPMAGPRGAVSLWTSGASGCAFDNLVVTAATSSDQVAGPVTFAGMNGWTEGEATQWSFASGVLTKNVGPESGRQLRLAPATDRNGLVRVRVRPARRDGGTFGLLARCSGADQHYRLAWDVAANELRLERQFGTHREVLGRTPLAAAGEQWRELALQTEGFRLQAFVDGRLFAQALDGGHADGRVGVFADSAAGCQFRGFAASRPVPWVATAALVMVAGELALLARAPAAVGEVYAVTFALDRPHVALPELAGCEPFVLQRMAAPLVAIGVGGLGSGMFGEVDPRGGIEARFRLPELLALRGQVVMVSALLGSPDASAATGRLPGIALRL
ncbi:MAG: hypothetical protein IPK26_00055 [Planctomycetes bacterium]|nr:hypothetical protein [Planctomycetota bacterium]